MAKTFGTAGCGLRGVISLAALSAGIFFSGISRRAEGQITTTTIQDTIYNADGSVASGTVLVSWTSFSTAANGTIASGNLTATIGADGLLSLNLTPNAGAIPEGTYYTAVYHLTSGTVSKEYWLVPAVAQTTVAAIRTQLIPAAVAVASASKQYVDSSITALSQTFVPLIGGSMTGPLVLNADPTAAAQATTKHYVDTQISAIPVGGAGNDVNAIHANTTSAQTVEGALAAASLGAPIINHVLYADQYASVQAAVTAACAATPIEMVVIPNTVAASTTSPEFTNGCAAAVVDQRIAHTDVFDVRAYGAACTGAVDDTLAIQTAINAASAEAQQSGRTSAQVQLPDAQCRGNVTLYSNVSLNGHYGARLGSAGLGTWNIGQPVITVAPGASNVGIHDVDIFGQAQSLVMNATSISRVSGVVTVTSNAAVPAVVVAGAPINLSGVARDTTFNGLYTVVAVPLVTHAGVTSNGTSFTYSEAAPLAQCARSSNVVTCTTTVPLPNNGYTAFSSGTNVTVSGAADASYNGSFVVTALTGFAGGGTNYPTAFTYANTGANGSTTGGTAYPANASITGGIATDANGLVRSILSGVRTSNTLALQMAGPIYGWAGGPGSTITISGSTDATLNGSWTVNGYEPGANYISVVNAGANDAISAGAVNNLMDKGIWIPDGYQVDVERVTGVNFGDGFLDWEGGEVLYVNHVQGSSCLQDVTAKTVRQLPAYPPLAGSIVPAVSPMGCVVLNGTDGYMEYSEISTGSVATSGTKSVVDVTLPSKAIVNGWNGINNWYESNIGELSDEGIWSGGQFNRWYMNRADLNAGTGIEDASNNSIWVGNMALHDGLDAVVAPGTWIGINETGAGQNVLGSNIWNGNSVVDSAPLAYDINDGRTSGSGTPNIWSGNFAQSYSTPAGYSSSFQFSDNDFKQSLAAFTGVLGQSVAGLHNVLLQGSSAGQQVGNFTGGVPGQRIRVMSNDGFTTLLPGSGYALRTCSGYPFTPMAGNGVTGFTLQGDYEMAWQMDCPQVSAWQIEGHGSLSLMQTANPTQAPGIGQNGTAGTSSYSYVCTQVNYQGIETLPTSLATTTTGNATLNGTNSNVVVCPAAGGTGLAGQKVYRTGVPSGSTLGLGYIGTTATVGYTGMVDSGQAVISAGPPPGVNHTADCENAALALLAASTSPSAAWSGKYSIINAQQTSDIWPGDALAIQSAALNLTTSVIVRSVAITLVAEQPEMLIYATEFANDWAEALAIKTSAAVPKDTWLPQTAVTAPLSLPSLTNLVAAVTSMQINVTAGITAPSGGGFEVRRVDWQFGTGSDGTLVLRSTVPNFSILREAAIEQYFVRMYDGSTPPNYSRFSNAICASVPL